MNESILRRTLLAIAVLGLATGIIVWQTGLGGVEAGTIWAAATLPVVAMLAVSILRDFWIGRFGVDAIALVAMAAALLLGQPLAAIVVSIMYAGGTVLEDFARGRAERDLKALTDRTPRIAHRKSGHMLENIGADQVQVGDELVVRAGELLPVDGILLDPWASLDESAVTGEPLPEKRRAGDALRSGTVNAGETFGMRATALADQSTYAAIVRMVAAAQTSKAPFIRLADRFALFLLPATLLVAGIAWQVSGDPIRALAVLVVATPCPLILAAPVAFIGGVSRAARFGVLMKGSAALEALALVRTAVFDKTGTLTQGGAELMEIETAPGRDDDEALRLLASLEMGSHHVLGDAIIRTARNKGLTLSHPTDVREYRGAGLVGHVDDISVKAGSRKLVLADDPVPAWAQVSEARYRDQPVLRVFLALDGQVAGVFTFGDALRADARDALRELRSGGIARFVMLTGDDEAAANRISALLDLDTVVADATPADKIAFVDAEKAKAPTMMVGDGINDAPALAAATVGVAMAARGATASSEAADVIVLTDRLQPVADAVRVAQRTRAIAMQSIVVGLALSAIAMVAAAFGQITPVAGALLQEGIDVAVILNALRALADGRSKSALNATVLSDAPTTH